MLDQVGEIKGTGSLNTLASWGLGTAMVLAIVAIAVGVLYFARRSHGGDRRAKGVRIVALACVGAAFLASVPAGIQWGINQGGTSNLMPAAAQPHGPGNPIVVDKKKAVSTCDKDAAEYNILESDASKEAKLKLFDDVTKSVSDAKGKKGKKLSASEVRKKLDSALNTGTGNYAEGTYKAQKLIWTPRGTQCTTRNRNAAPGTEIKLVLNQNLGAGERVGTGGASVKNDEKHETYTFTVPKLDD